MLERLHLSRSGCRSAIVAPRELKPRGSGRFAYWRICGNRYTMTEAALASCLVASRILHRVRPLSANICRQHSTLALGARDRGTPPTGPDATPDRNARERDPRSYAVRPPARRRGGEGGAARYFQSGRAYIAPDGLSGSTMTRRIVTSLPWEDIFPEASAGTSWSKESYSRRHRLEEGMAMWPCKSGLCLTRTSAPTN